MAGTWRESQDRIKFRKDIRTVGGDTFLLASPDSENKTSKWLTYSGRGKK